MRNYHGTAGSVFAAFLRIAQRDAALAAGVVAFWAVESAVADPIPAHGLSVVDSIVVEWSYNLDAQFAYVNVRATPGTESILEKAQFETPGAEVVWVTLYPRYATEVTSGAGLDRIQYEHTAAGVYLGTTTEPYHHYELTAMFAVSAVPVELAWSTYNVKRYGEPEFSIPFVTVQSIIPEPSAAALLAAGALAAAARRRMGE